MAKKRKVHSLTGRITFPLLHAAWKAARRNRGAASIDKANVGMFEANLDEHLQALMRDLKNGSFEPKPLRCEIRVDYAYYRCIGTDAYGFDKRDVCCVTLLTHRVGRFDTAMHGHCRRRRCLPIRIAPPHSGHFLVTDTNGISRKAMDSGQQCDIMGDLTSLQQQSVGCEVYQIAILSQMSVLPL